MLNVRMYNNLSNNTKTVPQEILDQAKNCPYNRACIKDSDHEQCSQKYILSHNLTAIKHKDTIDPKAGIDIENYPYFISLPKSTTQYCTCPVYAYLQKQAHYPN